MHIFSYLPQTTPGPNGSTTRYTDTDPGSLTEVGTYNNRTIVIAPDSTTPPAQPAAIDWQQDSDPSPTLLAWIGTTRYGQLLSAARDDKHRARNAARLAAETAGFTFTHNGAYSIDSDEKSVMRITSAAAVAAVAKSETTPYSVTWTCADDRQLTLDADGMLALQHALVSHGQHCHDVSQAIKAAIDAAETLHDLSAIDVSSGY